MDQKQISWKKVLLDTLMMITWDTAVNDPEDYIQCVGSIKRQNVDCERHFLLKKSRESNNKEFSRTSRDVFPEQRNHIYSFMKNEARLVRCSLFVGR